jgi:hypothetical protein
MRADGALVSGRGRLGAAHAHGRAQAVAQRGHALLGTQTARPHAKQREEVRGRLERVGHDAAVGQGDDVRLTAPPAHATRQLA